MWKEINTQRREKNHLGYRWYRQWVLEHEGKEEITQEKWAGKAEC